MIIVFTGNGKGKTSAALGVALRSLGWEKRICIAQFIKGNKEIGEWKLIKNIASPQIDIHQFHNDEQYGISDKKIQEDENYKKSCLSAWEFVKNTYDKDFYDVFILDEIINAIGYDLVDEGEVIDFLKNVGAADHDLPEKQDGVDFILTGRMASDKLVEMADMVTEMKEIKHPFEKSIGAKKGIDY